MKKKKQDELGFVFDNIKINTGIIGGTYMMGKLSNSMPSNQSNKIMSGMSTLRIVPTIHAMGGIMGQLQSLEHKIKKKR